MLKTAMANGRLEVRRFDSGRLAGGRRRSTFLPERPGHSPDPILRPIMSIPRPIRLRENGCVLPREDMVAARAPFSDIDLFSSTVQGHGRNR